MSLSAPTTGAVHQAAARAGMVRRRTVLVRRVMPVLWLAGAGLRRAALAPLTPAASICHQHQCKEHILRSGSLLGKKKGSQKAARARHPAGGGEGVCSWEFPAAVQVINPSSATALYYLPMGTP